MVDELERLLTENLALRRYVNTIREVQEARRKKNPKLHPAATTRHLIEAMQKIQGTPSLATRVFAPLRTRINEDAELESVMRDFLRLVQPYKDVN